MQYVKNQLTFFGFFLPVFEKCNEIIIDDEGNILEVGNGLITI